MANQEARTSGICKNPLGKLLSEMGTSETTMWGMIAEKEKPEHLTPPSKQRTQGPNEKFDENQKKQHSLTKQEVGSFGFSKNQRGKIINSEHRLLAFNLYTFRKSEGNSKSHSVSLAALEMGISKTILWRIIAEMEKTGHLSSPSTKRIRKSINEKLNEDQKKRVRSHVDSLFLNEPPTLNAILEVIQNDKTLPRIGRTSLWILMKKLGFVWERRGRTSYLLPG